VVQGFETKVRTGRFFFFFFWLEFCLAWFWFLLILTLWRKRGLDGIMGEGRWWYKDSNTPPKFTLKVSHWGSAITFFPSLILLRYNLCLPLFNFTLDLKPDNLHSILTLTQMNKSWNKSKQNNTLI